MKNLSDDFPMTLNMLRDINARVKNPTAPWHKIVPVMDMVIYIKKEEVGWHGFIETDVNGNVGALIGNIEGKGHYVMDRGEYDFLDQHKWQSITNTFMKSSYFFLTDDIIVMKTPIEQGLFRKREDERYYKMS